MDSGSAQRKIGIALSGGGAKGSFQAEVLRQIYRHLTPFCKAGISVGSLNGSISDPDKLIHLWKGMRQEDVFKKRSMARRGFQYALHKIGVRKPVRSLYSNEPLYTKIQEVITEKPDLLAGRVNLRTGEYRNDLTDQFQKEILASTAVPGVWEPVMIDGEPWVDGGLLHNTPIKEIIDQDPDVVIIITNQPLDREMDNRTKDIVDIAKASLSVGLDAIFNRDIEKFLRKNETEKYFPYLIVAPDKDLGDMLDFSLDAFNWRTAHARNVFDVEKLKALL